MWGTRCSPAPLDRFFSSGVRHGSDSAPWPVSGLVDEYPWALLDVIRRVRLGSASGEHLDRGQKIATRSSTASPLQAKLVLLSLKTLTTTFKVTIFEAFNQYLVPIIDHLNDSAE